MLSWLCTFKAKFVAAYDCLIGIGTSINKKDCKWYIYTMATKLDNTYLFFKKKSVCFIWHKAKYNSSLINFNILKIC